MIAALKKVIAQLEALPEAEQAEVVELLLAALKERASASGTRGEGVSPEVRSVIDTVAERHVDALGKLA